MKNTIRFRKTDGGRAAAGYKGQAGDCVTRAVANATGLPYPWVYGQLAHRMKTKRRRKKSPTSPREGVPKDVIRCFMADLGLMWVPFMGIGKGCRVHVRADELPLDGMSILSLSGHLTAYVDGELRDTYDPSRDGNRCVYGLWLDPRTSAETYYAIACKSVARKTHPSAGHIEEIRQQSLKRLASAMVDARQQFPDFYTHETPAHASC